MKKKLEGHGRYGPTIRRSVFFLERGRVRLELEMIKQVDVGLFIFLYALPVVFLGVSSGHVLSVSTHTTRSGVQADGWPLLNHFCVFGQIGWRWRRS